MTDTCIAVVEATDTSEVRRLAMALGAQLGFDETSGGNLALVATAAARKLLKHPGGGQMILKCLQKGGRKGIEILALDKRPVIKDVRGPSRTGSPPQEHPAPGWGRLHGFPSSTTCKRA